MTLTVKVAAFFGAGIIADISTRREIVLDKLRAIAAAWGWAKLRQEKVEYVDPETCRLRRVVWYVAGQDDWCRRNVFYLQINESPIGQQSRYCVAVYALRFRICTGWYCFRLSNRRTERERITALRELIGKHLFATPIARRNFRKAHPECAEFTERLNARRGAPFRVVDAKAGTTEPAPRRK